MEKNKIEYSETTDKEAGFYRHFSSVSLKFSHLTEEEFPSVYKKDRQVSPRIPVWLNGSSGKEKQ